MPEVPMGPRPKTEIFHINATRPRFLISDMQERDGVVRNCAGCLKLFSPEDYARIMRDIFYAFNGYEFCCACLQKPEHALEKAAYLDMLYHVWLQEGVMRYTNGMANVAINMKLIAN